MVKLFYKWGDYINTKDILFQLNGGKEDLEVIQLIEQYTLEMQNITYKQKYKVFKTNEVSNILQGEDIKKYSEYSNETAIFIITLSHDVDKKLRMLEKIDKLKYIVYDTVASHYVEHLCSNMQNEIHQQLLKNNKYALARFSAGYGDFDININKTIYDMLDASRLGVYLTEKNMFIPSKTITGIICAGDINESFNFCQTCNITNECKLIKEGRKCYE